jgi:hypothetical protein
MRKYKSADGLRIITIKEGFSFTRVIEKKIKEKLEQEISIDCEKASLLEKDLVASGWKLLTKQ